MTAREFLTKYNESNGYGTDDKSLIESLIYGSKTVHEGERNVHRWYITEDRVADIDGTFIWYIDYIITGDNSMSDMGLEYDLDQARIVERKERQITEVYYE